MTLRPVSLDQLNAFGRGTMMDALGITITEVGEDHLAATMPVDHRTHQPMGLLHGGASAALIETIGSIGSSLLVDLATQAPVGLEINANHLGSVRSGSVRGVGRIVHAGRRTHVWQVDITDEDTGKLVCTGRLTVMLVDR